MIWNCIIIGAGASGLYAASHLKIPGVLILEKKHKVGLKLSISGSGQCNLTHDGYANQFLNKYGDKKAFVKGVLAKHDNKAVLAHFKDLGVDTVTRDDGKIFPSDFKASSVIQVLTKRIDRLGHVIKLNASVSKITVMSNGFEVNVGEDAYQCKNLIIATGGKSYPVLGTEGDGFAFASSMGHKVTPLKPGLTGVVTGDHLLRELSGIGFKGLELMNVRMQKKYSGDLLITHFGISGPVILNNSRDFDRGDVLEINWVKMSGQSLDDFFRGLVQTDGSKPISFALNQLDLPERLKTLITNKSSIDLKKRLSELSKDQRLTLVSLLTRYLIKVDSLQGFNDAMVTVGGVECSEINPQKMMSNFVPNLYFTGEVIDVDGETGGYNLQWAFSSAYVAVQAINSSL